MDSIMRWFIYLVKKEQKYFCEENPADVRIYRNIREIRDTDHEKNPAHDP